MDGADRRRRPLSIPGRLTRDAGRSRHAADFTACSLWPHRPVVCALPDKSAPGRDSISTKPLSATGSYVRQQTDANAHPGLGWNQVQVEFTMSGTDFAVAADDTHGQAQSALEDPAMAAMPKAV